MVYWPILLLPFSLPYYSLADNVVQVWNSSSYCSNDLIYTCINENSPIIIWDVFDKLNVIEHFAVFGNTTRSTVLESVIVGYRVTHINSTSLYSTLVLTELADAPSQNNYNIYCNSILADNTPRSSISNPLPSTIQLTVMSTITSITWNSAWDEYIIEEYSSTDDLIRSWTTDNQYMTSFNLSNSVKKVKMSVCLNLSINFTIECCLFNKTMRANESNIMNNYTIHLDKNSWEWELTCANSSKTFFTYCNSNGSWENLEICGLELTSQSNNSRTSEESPDYHIPQGFDVGENHTQTSNNLSLILVLSITPAGIVLLVISILLIIIPSRMWNYKTKFNNSNIENENPQAATYEQLSNFPIQNNTGANATPGHQSNASEQEEYSTLKHLKLSLPPSADYDTINCAKSSRYKRSPQLEYAEVHACDNCGQAKPFKDYRVKYANICNQEEMADEQLNLHTLSAQLGEISESFIAFGSVAGVSPASLSEIVVKSSSYNDSMTEVCDMWLKKCEQEQTPPTWHMVAEILDLIGHKEFSKKLLQVYVKGALPVPVYKDSFAKISNSKEVPLSSENNKDEKSWSDEAPPIPPFNPQCLSGPEDMPPPLYEDVQVIALRPLASGSHSQSGPEDVTTFIGASNEVSEAVGMENL